VGHLGKPGSSRERRSLRHRLHTVCACAHSRDMSEELSRSESTPDAGNEPNQLSQASEDPPSASTTPGGASPLVLLINAVTVGLGGVYVSTHSIIITVAAAALVAVLALCLVASMRCGS
jgi:hypothetical protein